ncbi:MAG TPA: metalloregulator ArsR/SmtB family transcription factor [Bryobacteraceae bacterium]|jgi:DNA-binding transcriptional ArsR family regulator|nr:metalloregulator ArsR/SmtB family transcription factor [Bryobacteraceae bacterium]
MSAKLLLRVPSGNRKTRRGFEKTALIFGALGDENRLRLVSRLSADGPMSIARLTEGGSVTRQAVTKHLQVLAQVGLARNSRLGRESVWELEPKPLDNARHCLDAISAQWDVALDRLKTFVEQ